MRLLEIREAILNDYFDDLTALVEYINDKDNDCNFSGKQCGLLTELFTRRRLLNAALVQKYLPSLEAFNTFNLTSQNIVDTRYDAFVCDYARPQQLIDHLSTLCANDKERELLRFTVYAYEDTNHKYGILVPIVEDTRVLLERIAPDMVPELCP